MKGYSHTVHKQAQRQTRPSAAATRRACSARPLAGDHWRDLSFLEQSKGVPDVSRCSATAKFEEEGRTNISSGVRERAKRRLSTIVTLVESHGPFESAVAGQLAVWPGAATPPEAV